jgi:hypothetical protein
LSTATPEAVSQLASTESAGSGTIASKPAPHTSLSAPRPPSSESSPPPVAITSSPGPPFTRTGFPKSTLRLSSRSPRLASTAVSRPAVQVAPPLTARQPTRDPALTENDTAAPPLSVTVYSLWAASKVTARRLISPGAAVKVRTPLSRSWVI